MLFLTTLRYSLGCTHSNPKDKPQPNLYTYNLEEEGKEGALCRWSSFLVPYHHSSTDL
jgi:hypothetical protein